MVFNVSDPYDGMRNRCVQLIVIVGKRTQYIPFYTANYGSYVVTGLAAQNYTSFVD